MEIVLSKFIEPGNQIELRKVRKLKEDEGSIRKVYKSQLIDILSDDRIEISMPMEKTKLILLPVGEEYDLYFRLLYAAPSPRDRGGSRGPSSA